jgi:hypothetical protein
MPCWAEHRVFMLTLTPGILYGVLYVWLAIERIAGVDYIDSEPLAQPALANFIMPKLVVEPVCIL